MAQIRRFATQSLAVFLCCVAVAPATAQSAQLDTDEAIVDAESAMPGGRTVWSLYWENDGSFIKPNHNTDRHYTNGVRIVMSAEHQWANDLAVWLPMAPAEGEALESAAFYSIGHLIFTPDNIENPGGRRPDDRSYAGWLYFSAGLERTSETIADRIDLKIGVIGPASLAEESQQNVHDYFDEDREPIGWDDQLSNRFAIDLDVNRRWKFSIDHDPSDHVAIELIPEAGFTIGSVHNHLMAGATLRIGSSFLPGDFGAGRLEAPSTAARYPSGGGGENENLAWSIYARVEGRAVFHNELLEGVVEEDFFGQVQVGVSLLIAKNLSIGYSQTWFSQEYESQIANDSIGALALVWSYAY